MLGLNNPSVLAVCVVVSLIVAEIISALYAAKKESWRGPALAQGYKICCLVAFVHSLLDSHLQVYSKRYTNQ